MKEEMRKLAEEEILKELRMAEEFFKRNDFEQTQKGGYHFYEERDDDLEERDTTPPTVSGAEDEERKDHSHAKDPPTSPVREMTWGEALDQ